ncbi:hypothetical protein PAMP_022535 [Pampus punctatissimus]
MTQRAGLFSPLLSLKPYISAPPTCHSLLPTRILDYLPLIRCFLLRSLNKWADRVGPATSAGGTGFRATLDLPTCSSDLQG